MVQRAIEEAGIPTVGISISREISEKIKPPRTLFLKYPFGHPFGEAFNEKQQEAIFSDALELLLKAKKPGEIVDSPYNWRRTKFE